MSGPIKTNHLYKNSNIKKETATLKGPFGGVGGFGVLREGLQHSKMAKKNKNLNVNYVVSVNVETDL